MRMSNARRASANLFEKNLIRDLASFTEATQTASNLLASPMLEQLLGHIYRNTR